jgi:hypothetical protein
MLIGFHHRAYIIQYQGSSGHTLATSIYSRGMMGRFTRAKINFIWRKREHEENANTKQPIHMLLALANTAFQADPLRQVGKPSYLDGGQTHFLKLLEAPDRSPFRCS